MTRLARVNQGWVQRFGTRSGKAEGKRVFFIPDALAPGPETLALSQRVHFRPRSKSVKPLTIVLYQTNPAKADGTSRQLARMRHQVAAHVSARPLLHQTLREEPVDVAVIDCDEVDHRVLVLVRSIEETTPVPTLLVVGSFDSLREGLAHHPSVGIVRRGASDAEMRARIEEARTRFQIDREFSHRVDRLKARVRHGDQIALAKALLMNELDLAEDEAYAALRTESQNRRMKVEDVARVVLSQGVQAVSVRTRAFDSQ